MQCRSIRNLISIVTFAGLGLLVVGCSQEKFWDTGDYLRRQGFGRLKEPAVASAIKGLQSNGFDCDRKTSLTMCTKGSVAFFVNNWQGYNDWKLAVVSGHAVNGGEQDYWLAVQTVVKTVEHPEWEKEIRRGMHILEKEFNSPHQYSTVDARHIENSKEKPFLCDWYLTLVATDRDTFGWLVVPHWPDPNIDDWWSRHPSEDELRFLTHGKEGIYWGFKVH